MIDDIIYLLISEKEQIIGHYQKLAEEQPITKARNTRHDASWHDFLSSVNVLRN